MNPAHTITDERWREIEISRRADQPHLPPQIQIRRGPFQVRLAGTVDQVKAVMARTSEALLDAIDRRLDSLGHQPRCPEKTKHTRPGHRFDHLHRADAVGHFPRDICITNAMRCPECRVSECLRAKGRYVSEERQRIAVGLW